MNKLKLLHISDVHERAIVASTSEERKRRIKYGVATRYLLLETALEKILDKINRDGAIDFVCLTGDVADYGLDEEYALATARLNKILRRLGLSPDRLIAVPGNHDVARGVASDAWAELRELAKREPDVVSRWMAGDAAPRGTSAKRRDEILERTAAFWRWVSAFRGDEALQPGKGPHGRLGYRYSPNSHPRIHFLGLDSAWLAGDDNDTGKLILSDGQLNLLCTTDEGVPLPGLRIALVHHPLSALADYKRAYQQLAARTDLLLHGHIHEPTMLELQDPDRALRTLAAGSLFEGDAEDKWINSFHRIDITLSDGGRPTKYEVTFYGWSPDGQFWHKTSAVYREAKDGCLVWQVEPREDPPSDSTPSASVRATDPTRGSAGPFELALARTLALSSREDEAVASRFFELIADFTSTDEAKGEGEGEGENFLWSIVAPSARSLDVRLHGDQELAKTWLMAALYKTLHNHRDPRELLYVNASELDTLERVENLARPRISELEKQTFERSEKRFIVLIDHLTGNTRSASKELCVRLLERLKSDRVDVVWNVSDDFEAELDSLVAARHLGAKRIVNVRPINTRGEDFPEYLRHLQWMGKRLDGADRYALPSSNDDALGSRMLEMLDDPIHLDLSLAWIALKALGDAKYAAAPNLSEFLRIYCTEQMRRDPTSGVADLAAPAVLAYRLVAQSFHGDEQESLAISTEDRQDPAWALASRQGPIRAFLCALHICRTICQCTTDSVAQRVSKSGVLAYDFPKAINGFLVPLVRSLKPKEKKQFAQGCRTLLDRLPTATAARTKKVAEGESLHARNLIYYLLGRTDDEGARPLNRALAEVEGRLSSGGLDPSRRIALKAERRTVMVSLMRLNRGQASHEGTRFIQNLIADREEAAIDRGYHQIYYDDRRPSKDRGADQYLDDLSFSWSRSFDALKSRLDEQLFAHSAGSQDFVDALSSYETQHRILTLVSFVQSRLGTPDVSKEQVDYAHEVIACALQCEACLVPEFVDYLCMMRCDIERGDASKWRFIADLYRLKWEPRRGWLMRNVDDEFAVGRIESVSDHNYFVVLLGELLLPEVDEAVPGYSKPEVLRLVLFHDVGEALTGDFIRARANGLLKKMDAAEDLSMRYLRFKEGYSGVFGTQSLFDRWQKFTRTQNTDVNAAIARDLDRLENLMQLVLYRELRPDAITDAVFAEFSSSLNAPGSAIGAKLMASLLEWASKADRARACAWTHAFRDRALLASEERVVGASPT